MERITASATAPGAYTSPTLDSRQKGDEGIYAAMDAARMSQALRGATLSRLTARDRTLLPTTLPAAAHAATGALPLPRRTQDTAAATSNGASGPVLGVPPHLFQPTNASECVRTRVRQEALQDPGINHEHQVPVGIPDSVSTPAFRAVAAHVEKARPGHALDYDELQKLVQLTETVLAAATEWRPREGESAPNSMATWDLAGCAIPPSVAARGGSGDDNAEDAEGDGDGSNDGNSATGAAAASGQRGAHLSLEALAKVMAELKERYPLPTPKNKTRTRGNKGDEDDENEEEDGEDEDEDGEETREALRHNEELRARCERLQIPYTNYRDAIHDVALYETEIFPLICRFLSTNRHIKVVLMDHNKLGAESQKAEGTVDLRALRALAAMIDANESIKVLDLSHNALGPNGVGIVAKALTKNICLQEIDLSENRLNAEPLEETEDPEFEEEDPVFGERYSGLEAISEVLKKNKFLRVLRLGGNGIHAGDDLTAPAEEDNGGVEEDELNNDAGTSVAIPTPEDVIAAWEEVPLWRLVQPLQTFHRLTVLDLRGNQLGVLGARMLATALASNHSLRALDLTDNGIGYRGLHYLASLVLASPTSVLETLILQRNNLAGKSRNPNTQKKLRLKPKKAALAAMDAFASAMHGNRTVRRLVLSENHLGPVLSAAMLSTIPRAEMLEELDFSWNEACGDHESALDLTAIRSLAAALYPSPYPSEVVDEAGAVIGSRPPHRPTLARLYLSGNNLCAAGLAALFPQGGLTPQYALQVLDLSRNYVGDALEPLSHLLAVCPTLRCLNLAYNNISTMGPMLPGLQANASLETLDMGHNKLGSCEEQRHLPANFGGTAVTMVGSLKNAQSLQAAALKETIGRNDAAACEAQREEISALWACLVTHPTLADVTVSWNDLREVHATDFIEVLSKPQLDDKPVAPCLARVDWSNNPKIPAEVVKSLIAVLATRSGMRAVYASLPRKQAGGSQVGDPLEMEGEKLQQQAAAEVASTMAACVSRSSSLLDIGCWGADFGENSEDTVEALRRKLLLNALLAGSS